MSNVRILYPVKDLTPPDHDPLCATVKAVEEGWLDRQSNAFCTCEYVQEIRLDDRLQLRTIVERRVAMLERRWASEMTDTRVAYVQGMYAGAETTLGMQS